jgi:hypothetical protein
LVTISAGHKCNSRTLLYACVFEADFEEVSLAMVGQSRYVQRIECSGQLAYLVRRQLKSLAATATMAQVPMVDSPA